MTVPGSVEPPCIGICSTTYGGDVCRGCKRFAHEVIDWNRYDDAQRQLVWDRLNRLTGEVVATRVVIRDAGRLSEALKARGLRFPAEQSPAHAVMALLRASGRHRLPDPDSFGIAFIPPNDIRTPAEIHEEMNTELLARAEAWFDLHHGRARRFLHANPPAPPA